MYLVIACKAGKVWLLEDCSNPSVKWLFIFTAFCLRFKVYNHLKAIHTYLSEVYVLTCAESPV